MAQSDTKKYRCNGAPHVLIILLLTVGVTGAAFLIREACGVKLLPNYVFSH